MAKDVALTYVETEERTTKKVVIDKEFNKIIEIGGVLTPEIVLEHARDENNPLHSFFQWDDEVAGYRYRLEQARRMIMSSRVVVQVIRDGRNKPVEMHHVRKLLPEGGKSKRFQLRQDVLGEKEKRGEWIRNRLDVLRSWCKSVVDVKELDFLRTGIEQLLSKKKGD